MPADVLIVVNPVAGGGRAARLIPRLTRSSASLGARVLVTSRAGEAEEAAAAADADGYRRVVAVGGDGTVQEVLNGLTVNERAPMLGVVPAGSGNDLARTLRLPTDPARALETAISGVACAIDVAEAVDAHGTRRRFASAGGTGFDAQVAHIMAGSRQVWRRGRAGYLLSTLLELRRYHNTRLQLSWQDEAGGERQVELTALLAAFANGQYYGGGMRIAPSARADDGFLDLCVVGDISHLEALRQLPGIYRGAHVGHVAVRMMRARRLRIDGEAAPVHLDGEPFGHLPLTVTLAPGALRIASPAGMPPRDS